ncbi:MFS transporter [Streptosporangium sp. NPDC023963]|uniref:MFS transporter n=1 Tax=Streptosporangium sp. NPDC023963 TaxID=3155608 RepID=UPI003439794D
MIFSRPTAGARLGPRFHWIWAAVTISSIGDGMRAVALPLLAAQITDDARQIALVALAGQLPFLLFSLASGVLSDRVDRRRILWIVDGLRALLMGALTVVVATQDLALGVVVAAGFLLATGQVFFNGGWAGMVPAIVEPGMLPKANARLQISVLVTGGLLGTPVGAFLFDISPAVPLIVDTATFAIAAVLVMRMPGPLQRRGDTPAGGPAAWGRDIAESVAWLIRHPLLNRLLLLTVLTNMTIGGVMAVLVLFAHESLGLSSFGYGVLTSAFAVGGLIGAAVSPYLVSRVRTSRLLRLGLLGIGLVGIGIGVAPSGFVACLFSLGFGVVNAVWALLVVSLRQTAVPTALLGRVSMATQMLVVGASALGAPIAGAVAHAMGPRAPIVAGAAVLALCGCLVSMRVADTTLPAGSQEPGPSRAETGSTTAT